MLIGNEYEGNTCSLHFQYLAPQINFSWRGSKTWWPRSLVPNFCKCKYLRELRGGITYPNNTFAIFVKIVHAHGKGSAHRLAVSINEYDISITVAITKKVLAWAMFGLILFLLWEGKIFDSLIPTSITPRIFGFPTRLKGANRSDLAYMPTFLLITQSSEIRFRASSGNSRKALNRQCPEVIPSIKSLRSSLLLNSKPIKARPTRSPVYW